MSRRRIVIAALVGLSGIGGALACGPFFPWQLLEDREATLSDPPVGLGFMSQLKNLVPPPQGTLKAVDHIDDEDALVIGGFHGGQIRENRVPVTGRAPARR